MQIPVKLMFPGSNQTDIFVKVIFDTQIICWISVNIYFQKLLCEFFEIIHTLFPPPENPKWFLVFCLISKFLHLPFSSRISEFIFQIVYFIIA